MRLRKLEEKDAPLMLEWMHDKDVVEHLNTDFLSKTIEDCQAFIKLANSENLSDKHYAIVDDHDEYMGTVSLKHIDYTDKTAEFAIAVRKKAMGAGFAWFGMKLILDIAINEFGLRRVYWCVSKKNKRAIRFYEKHNFTVDGNIPDRRLEEYKNTDLQWFSFK